MLNSELSNESFVFGSNVGLGADTPEITMGAAELDDVKIVRCTALAVLSRIARLLSVSVDDILSYLLISQSVDTLFSSPHSEMLTQWGLAIHANISQTGKSGFIEGIPVRQVVQPSALAYLSAFGECESRLNLFSLICCLSVAIFQAGTYQKCLVTSPNI